jgi:hypothetical protein
MNSPIQRKLCFSGNVFLFTIPKHTGSIWYGRIFKLEVLKEPNLQFIYTEIDPETQDNYDKKFILRVHKNGTYEALRAPYKIVFPIIEEFGLDKNPRFLMNITLGLRHKITFTHLDAEEQEKRFEKINRINGSPKPRRKTIYDILNRKIEYIVLPQSGFPTDYHITYINARSIPHQRSLCNVPLEISSPTKEIQTYFTDSTIHYCNSCMNDYKEKTNEENHN